MHVTTNLCVVDVRECRSFDYRRTLKTGALTVTIVINESGVVKPTQTYRSRTGAHGEDVYCLSNWSGVWVVHLNQSNSGRRSISFSNNIPDNVKRIAEQLWIYENVSVHELEKLLSLLYKQSVTLPV
jgi:hypothetical protein